MKVIKGLFFDLDGTLVDTLEANYQAYAKALKNQGYAFKREQYQASYGVRSDVFIRQFFPDITDEKIKRAQKDKAAIYKEYMHLVKPNKQLIDFVKTLRSNHTTALVTMATRENSSAVIKAIGLTDLFDYVICGDEVSKPKPDPEIYLKALVDTGLDADEVLAFEDSEGGMQSAVSAGIRVLTIDIPPTTKDVYEN